MTLPDTSAEAPRILIVDDDTQIRKFLRISLEASGFEVIETRLGEDALKKAALQRPSLIILDLGLPDLDGQEVIQRLREWTETPIIVLSVRSNEREKVRALDSGANDYVVKPFGVLELLARVRAALRLAERGELPAEAVVRSGDLEVDLPARVVRLSGAPVHLTKKEFELLKTLAQSAGRVLTHGQLLEAVWGPAHVEQSQYLRFHIGQLRKKLGDDPERPRYVVTEPGVGYRLAVD
jgi:two-component system KDP operon response regulator KdpE